MRPQTCISCQEAITNPICPECLEREIRCWLSERKPELVPYLSGFGNHTTKDWVTNCIVCGNKMGLCIYCFTKEILEIIKEKAPELEEDFLFLFNFELD